MSRLSNRKSRLSFITDASKFERGKRRDIVLEPEPMILHVRLHGTRRKLDVPYDAIYDLACKIEANRLRAEKKAKKAGK